MLGFWVKIYAIYARYAMFRAAFPAIVRGGTATCETLLTLQLPDADAPSTQRTMDE